MATSGKLNTTAWSHSSGTRFLELSWEIDGIYPDTLTTVIKWTLTAKGTYSGYVMAAPFTVKIDGKTVYNSSTRIKLYQNTVVATGDLKIKYNSDGKKSFAASVSAAIYSSTVNCSGSKTFTLDRIGMATITKAPNFNDEENPTIEYQNPLGNDVVSLQATISLTGAVVDIPYKDIPKTGKSYTFELTEDERNILRAATKDSNSREVFFYLRTEYKDTTYFDYKQVNYTIVNAAPTMDARVYDWNEETLALTGDRNTIIRYHNRVYAGTTGIPKKGAEIVEHRVEHNGIIKVNTFFDAINTESNVFSFYVIDSRGNAATKTIVAPMIDYIKPTVNIDTSALMDTNGTYIVKCGGNYYNDTFGYTDAATANKLSVKYRYKLQNGTFGAWNVMTATITENSYTATATISGLNYRETYIIQCQVSDRLNVVNSAETTIRSLPVFHWGENDFTFEVPVNFNAGTTGINELEGDLRLLGDTLAFGEDNNTNIQQTASDALTINAADIRLNGNVYLGDNTNPLSKLIVDAGTWVPTLGKAAAVNSYPTQRGWYMKVGNVATIGFQVKAYIKSGYDTTVLEIQTPFNPRYAAFGGGVAHNINVAAGFCFEGWSLQDGVIAARLQPCNNTTAGNLNISSSAYYPTTTNQTLITLSGTICFIDD